MLIQNFSRQNPFGLTIALNEAQVAQGSIYWDDGESVDAEGFTAQLVYYQVKTRKRCMLLWYRETEN